MESLKESLSTHHVFKDLKSEYIDIILECAGKSTFKAGAFIFKTGEPAEEFYLVDSGKVGLEVYAPPKGPLNILTLNTGDFIGWSWLFPPHTWHFDARTITDTDVYVFDAIKVKEAYTEDFEFAYRLSHCFGQIMMQRLAATRLQLLDVFGKENGFHHFID